MAENQACQTLKPKLSQLLLRTLEQLEDPKYSTVPKTHWDELRPSILTKYAWMEGGQERDLKQAGQHCCEKCLTRFTTTAVTSTTVRAKTTAKSNSRVTTFRGLSQKIQPLWRTFSASKHLQADTPTIEIKSHGKGKKSPNKTEATTQPKQIEIKIQEEHKTKWLSQSFDHLEKQHLCQKTQYSVPAFEVLPPLYENGTHSLLYQNSYLLDGIKYDYDTSKTQQQRVKLYLNYMRFLRSVNKPLRPTDCEIIFGDAKILMNPAPHWEGSRINWLLELERKQELRRLHALEVQRLKDLPICKDVKVKKKAFGKNATTAPSHSQENETTKAACTTTRKGKMKYFFFKKSKKCVESKKIDKVV